MGRSKKRVIASCASSCCSLRSLLPATLKTAPATKAASTPFRPSTSATPSTVSERARPTGRREVRSRVSLASAHLRVLPVT